VIDPDDPDFLAEVKETKILLFGAICFLAGVLCIGIALLTN
jgi:hypothetical protein